MLRVCAVSGVCRVMKSARLRRSSSSSFSTPSSSRAFRAQKRIESDDPHLQSQPARSDDRADVAATDDSERLAGQLDAHEPVLFPLARLRRHVRARDLPGERKHQRDRMLGGGDRVAERRVHHDDAASRGGWNVDVVDADAGAANDLQFLRALEQLRRDLGRGANGEPVIVADDLGEFFLVEAWLDVDLNAARLENRDGGRGKLVGDENAGSHRGYPGMAARDGRENERETMVRVMPAESGHQRATPAFAGVTGADQAALASFIFSTAKAWSSQRVSASTSAVSTVAPHQMRKPGGASR